MVRLLGRHRCPPLCSVLRNLPRQPHSRRCVWAPLRSGVLDFVPHLLLPDLLWCFAPHQASCQIQHQGRLRSFFFSFLFLSFASSLCFVCGCLKPSIWFCRALDRWISFWSAAAAVARDASTLVRSRRATPSTSFPCLAVVAATLLPAARP